MYIYIVPVSTRGCFLCRVFGSQKLGLGLRPYGNCGGIRVTGWPGQYPNIPLAHSGPTEWHVGVLYHLSSSSVDATGHGKRPPEVQTGLLFTDKGTYSLLQVWEGQLPSASFNRGCQDRCSHPAVPLNMMSRPAGCPCPPSQPFPWATCHLKHLGSPLYLKGLRQESA